MVFGTQACIHEKKCHPKFYCLTPKGFRYVDPNPFLDLFFSTIYFLSRLHHTISLNLCNICLIAENLYPKMMTKTPQNQSFYFSNLNSRRMAGKFFFKLLIQINQV